MVFFCRNNGYAISTPTEQQYRGDGIAARGWSNARRARPAFRGEAVARGRCVRATTSTSTNRRRLLQSLRVVCTIKGIQSAPRPSRAGGALVRSRRLLARAIGRSERLLLLRLLDDGDLAAHGRDVEAADGGAVLEDRHRERVVDEDAARLAVGEPDDAGRSCRLPLSHPALGDPRYGYDVRSTYLRLPRTPTPWRGVGGVVHLDGASPISISSGQNEMLRWLPPPHPPRGSSMVHDHGTRAQRLHGARRALLDGTNHAECFCIAAFRDRLHLILRPSSAFLVRKSEHIQAPCTALTLCSHFPPRALTQQVPQFTVRYALTDIE